MRTNIAAPFLCLMLLLLSALASAQSVIKISTLYPPGSDAAKSLQALSDQVKERTNGDVLIKLYPGGVMGDDRTVLRKLRIGQLQGALVSSGTLELINADVKGLSQPFAYENLQQVYQIRESYDQEIRDQLKALKWVSYGPFDGGFSYLMSKSEVSDMNDIRQSKLWLPNTADVQKLSTELDVNYLVMNIGDVLTGLDTGAIDTLVSPPAAALTLNWYSRFNYFTDTPVLYTWGILILPEKAFKKLSDEQRAIVDEELAVWSEGLEARMRVANENALNAIRQLLKPVEFSEKDIQMLRISQNGEH